MPLEASEWFTTAFPERKAYLDKAKQNQEPLTEDLVEKKIKETEVLIGKEKSNRHY